MNFTLVIWHIATDRASDFERDWQERFKLSSTEGLVGEFLSRVEPTEAGGRFNEDLAKPGDTTYINVAIWRDKSAFERGVPPPGNPLAYETQPRQRILLSPVAGRLGDTSVDDFVTSVQLVD